MDHTLPDRIVVAERSLQAQIAQDQRIRDPSGTTSGDQPTLVTWPSGRASRSAMLNVSLTPDASHTTSAPSGDRARTISSMSCVCMSTVWVAPSRRAASSRACRPTSRRRSADPRRPAPPCARTAGRSGRARERPPRLPAESSTFMHIALYATACGSDRHAMIERQRVWNAMQTARRHAHPLRHRAVHAISKALARRTQVVSSGPAEHALAADVRRRFGDDPIAFLEPAHGVDRVAQSCRRTRGPSTTGMFTGQECVFHA